MEFDMPSCGGCRTCELACSFHHRGEFIPSASSLKVLEKKEGRGYTVLLKQEPDGSGPACDGCDDLEIPLCVEYCREVDDLFKILQKFNARKSKKAGTGPEDRGTRHDRG